MCKECTTIIRIALIKRRKQGEKSNVCKQIQILNENYFLCV